MHRNDTKSKMKQLPDPIHMVVRLGGVDSLLPAPASLISTILYLKVSFHSADIFTYAHLMSLFFCSSNHPHTVSLNSMGAFLSASSSAWQISVHGAGMLTSSVPPSANFEGWGVRPRAMHGHGMQSNSSSLFPSLCHP
jgi:hypothetical protein